MDRPTIYKTNKEAEELNNTINQLNLTNSIKHSIQFSYTLSSSTYGRTDTWNVVLEKTLESPLDTKEVKPINPKGNQPWIFIGRIDAEAEAPLLWAPDAKSWFVWKDPDAGKDQRQEEKGMTEDEMVGWYHRFNGREFEQTPGDGDGQGSLACCSPWGHKKSDRTEGLNNNAWNTCIHWKDYI